MVYRLRLPPEGESGHSRWPSGARAARRGGVCRARPDGEEVLDHEYVIVLDLTPLSDVREGENVEIILPGPDSPLLTWSPAAVTLRGGASAVSGRPASSAASTRSQAAVRNR